MDVNQPLDNDLQEGLSLSRSSQSFLSEAARWAKFIAIIGFIVCGLMVFGALGMLTMTGIMPGGSDELPFSPMLLVGIYLGFAIIYFFPILYLYRFATNAQDAIRGSSEHRLEVALENIKSHYKFMGILMIILIASYFLFFIGMVVTFSTGLAG